MTKFKKTLSLITKKMVRGLKKIKNMIFPVYQIIDSEKELYSAIEELLQMENTETRIAPLSDEYLIFNKQSEYIVSLSNGKIIFGNHDFYYEESFSAEFYDILLKMVQSYIQKNRDEIKTEMLGNKKLLLKKIRIQIQKDNK
jgi:hypothetical protein